ncbi:hypothetical protein JW948_09225 [bacterium]|nr:hypothetical protein [bacterium]
MPPDNDMFSRLLNAYSVQNLNAISSMLIQAYQRKDFDFLSRIAREMGLSGMDQSSNQVFYKLMMMVHPDRIAYYTQAIKRGHQTGDLNALNEFRPILNILKYLEPGNTMPRENRAWYGSDKKTRHQGTSAPPRPDSPLSGRPVRTTFHDFLSALKHKEYGNLDVIYRRSDLENTEGDLELSGYMISDLSGLEHCIHITGLNLSCNNIHDISSLGTLTLLEEIDLSLNDITHISALSGMLYLRTLDISFNQISDLTPVMDLERLEYINCIGNPVPESQFQPFRRKGVLIVFS